MKVSFLFHRQESLLHNMHGEMLFTAKHKKKIMHFIYILKERRKNMMIYSKSETVAVAFCIASSSLLQDSGKTNRLMNKVFHVIK